MTNHDVPEELLDAYERSALAEELAYFQLSVYDGPTSADAEDEAFLLYDDDYYEDEDYAAYIDEEAA